MTSKWHEQVYQICNTNGCSRSLFTKLYVTNANRLIIIHNLCGPDVSVKALVFPEFALNAASINTYCSRYVVGGCINVCDFARKCLPQWLVGFIVVPIAIFHEVGDNLLHFISKLVITFGRIANEGLDLIEKRNQVPHVKSELGVIIINANLKNEATFILLSVSMRKV